MLVGSSTSGGWRARRRLFVERVLKVDDPVGAISVHGVNGTWGVLSLGLFADGTYGTGWNGSFWYKVGDKLTWFAEKLTDDKVKELNAVEAGVTKIQVRMLRDAELEGLTLRAGALVNFDANIARQLVEQRVARISAPELLRHLKGQRCTTAAAPVPIEIQRR